jgi:hypothetical protein
VLFPGRMRGAAPPLDSYNISLYQLNHFDCDMRDRSTTYKPLQPKLMILEHKSQRYTLGSESKGDEKGTIGKTLQMNTI